jgi:hypothetical protein
LIRSPIARLFQTNKWKCHVQTTGISFSVVILTVDVNGSVMYKQQASASTSTLSIESIIRQ